MFYLSWDEKACFKLAFDQFDENKDRLLSAYELYKALSEAVPNIDFETTNILMRSYDRNNDGKINFNEYFRLSVMLNELYNLFLDHCDDGLIYSKELKLLLLKKNYNLSENFLENILENYTENCLSLNKFVKFYGRLNFLRNIFEKSDETCFEKFVSTNFF